MKKLILILLFLTGFLQAQTLQNPTYGVVTEKTNLEDNSATKVKVQDANGKSGWVNKSNFSNIRSVQNPIYYKGKNIYWFGDSYTAGSGASPTSNRFTTLVSNALGATEVNQGVAGTTMEKRVPINYMASPNMVDNVVNIPTKTASMAMLVFAFGLNDMGQTAPAYSTANYKTDYQTVLNNAFSKGWLPNQVLIIPAYYIGSAGYAAYATITGNAAPDVTRHLAFIQAAKEVAEANGTMYFDIYQDQKKNDITLISADNIHPNNAGYAYIANDILQYLGADKLSITTDTGYSTGSGFIPKINANKLDNSFLYQGSIGIGLATQSPKVGWHIHSASNTSSFMMTHTGTTDALARGVLFGLDTGLNFFINNRENAPIYFATNNSERMRIHASGGVSIGNTTDLGANTLNVTGTATAATPTLSTHLTTKGYVDGLVRPYKVDTALFSQTSTSAPTVTVLENTLSGAIVWTYTATGDYLGTLTGAFTASKTTVTINYGDSVGTVSGRIGGSRVSANTVRVWAVSNGVAADATILNGLIEIRVYN